MKRSILFMTVVSCVFMIAAATAVLSVERIPIDPIDGGGSEPPTYTSLLDEDYQDYLVSVEGAITYAADLSTDQDFLVQRTYDLKTTVWDTPGSAPVDYTKIVYTVNLKLRDISAFTDGVAGLFVSDLTVAGFGLKAPTLVSASIVINGAAVLLLVDGAALDASNYITWVYDAGTLSAQVALPSLDLTTALAYNDEDFVSIFVMFKVPETGLTLTGSDIGFPDYQPVPVP